ncbi:solute carrier family 25 member 38 [Cyathus striatus]|nr:solute carrier family 25 member 38 [Cyathus striatus]
MSHVGHQLLSGALSGFATTICLQPFDLLKTRMQQGDGVITPRHRSSIIFSTAREVIQENGISGLWRGTAPSLVRNVPGVALYMTSLTQLRTLMATSPYFSAIRRPSKNHNGSVLPTLTSEGNLLAGATTRVCVGFLLNPFSVLKSRYESNMYAYENLFGALVSITRQGPSELLRGFLPSSLRDAPYAGLFIVFYEGIKRETSYIFPHSSQMHSTIIHGCAAASAGAIATVATHPFDVIKTKMQVRSEDRYHGFAKTVVTIWKHRGIAGYFDGTSLRMSRKILSSAIGWAVYEGILMFVKSSQKHREKAV